MWIGGRVVTQVTAHSPLLCTALLPLLSFAVQPHQPVPPLTHVPQLCSTHLSYQHIIVVNYLSVLKHLSSANVQYSCLDDNLPPLRSRGRVTLNLLGQPWQRVRTGELQWVG